MADINVNPQDFEQFIQNLTRGGMAANDFSNANKIAADSIKKNAAALDKLEEFIKGLGSTVLSTEKGTGKYATSVTAATDAVGDIASKFGVLGAVAGGLIKILGGLAAASLKQNDALIKSYRSLSEFGNMDFSVDNIEKLKNDLASLGTTAENSVYIAQLIGKLAPDLVAFGGSVTKGKDEIFKLTSGLLNNKFEDQLNNLGYKTEEITEISSRYVAQLARVGATQGKSTDQLRASSFNYMVVLQQLSDLTGQSRDALQAQIDEQNRDVAFRAYLRTLSKEDATAAQAAIQAITAIGGKSMGDAAKEMAELNGGVRTAKSAMMQMYNPDLFDMYQQAMKSKNPALLMADEFRKRAPQINAAVNNLVGGVTAGGADMADALGQTTDLYDALERITALKDLNPEEYKKKVAELLAQTNGRLAEGKKQEQNERRAQNAYQQLIYTIGDQAVPMITKLTTALNTMGYMVAKFVKGMTGVDYTGIFETFENYNEAAKAITEEEKNQIELKKQSEVLQKKLDEEIKKKTDAAAKGKLSDWDSKAFDMDIRKAKDDLNDVRNQMASSRGRQENARMAQTGFTGGAPVTTGSTETGTKGIRMKAGAQAEGRTVDPALSALAKTISDQIPNFTYISSMNDDFHKNLIEKNGKISKHALGKALDFTLANKPTDEEGQAMVSLLKSMGASYAKDEYNHPSSNAVGDGHMHVEVARNGGLFNGPSSGYPVMLHGKESVLPTQALDNLVSKLPLPGTLFGNSNNSNMSNTDDLINALNGVQGVLDTLAETFRRSLGVQEDILTHTKMLA
jgi:hypothetical protein